MDRGRIKYSGPIQHLRYADSENSVFMLALQQDQGGLQQRLSGLPAVLSVERLSGSAAVYRITCHAEADTSLVLRGVIALGVKVESFVTVRTHLNQAFMDLTERGIN